MPSGFETGPYAGDLLARFGRRLVVDTLCPGGVEPGLVLAALDQLEGWAARTYEGQPIVAALGFTAEAARAAITPELSLAEAWSEEFSAVLTNGFDTMLVADGSGQVRSYEAMAMPAQPPPLAPVRLAAVAQWSADQPERLALVFARRAGRWFVLVAEAIVGQMGGPLDQELRRAVYASCLDASFAGTGAWCASNAGRPG
ncbi:MAG: hypothetical protein VKN13_06705 [Cyanobacteriota bacterium]|nr:hypothetical protein [Cyanobacteriota bacterium]